MDPACFGADRFGSRGVAVDKQLPDSVGEVVRSVMVSEVENDDHLFFVVFQQEDQGVGILRGRRTDA